MDPRATGLLVLLLTPGFTGPAEGQCEGNETQELVAFDGEPLDLYGTAVAMEGDLAVIGSYQDGDACPADPFCRSGSVYVYRKSGSAWTFEQKLTASDAEKFDQFGISVATDGTVILVGAFTDDDLGSNAGAAYVFRHDGAAWVEEQKLLPSTGAAGDLCGRSVAVQGDVALVGALYGDGAASDTGNTTVFRHDGAQWVEETVLFSSTGTTQDFFGISAALDGDVALVGALKVGGHGAAYVFRWDGNGWQEEQELLPSTPLIGDSFGQVTVQGDVAAVGDPFQDNSTGAVYVYEFDGNLWSESQKLTPRDAFNNWWFGLSVSLEDDALLVGAGLYSVNASTETGAAYLYRNRDGTWRPQQTLLASDAAHGDRMGSSVALSGTEALVGASYTDNLASDSGGAYLFEISPFSLSIDPSVAATGNTVTLSSCGGLPGSAVLVAAVDVNGQPGFWRLSVGSFDLSGVWQQTGTVPPGLGGTTVTFLAFGFLDSGSVAASNQASVQLL